MITPAYSMTSTERVLPRLALDFTTASLDPRVTVTRALNTATRVGSDGYIGVINADLPRFYYNPSTLACRGLLIEESRINIRSYSEDFSNAIWAPTGLNQTGTPAWVNVAASPANTLTADKLIADTSNGRHRVVGAAQATSSGSRYTMSIFAKKGEYSKIAIGEYNTGAGAASFNLQTGTVIATFGSGTPTASIEAYKDDWFRCILTFTAAAFSRFDVYALNDAYTNTDPSTYNFTGDNTSGVFIWGAQLELGAFATSYIPNLATGTTTRNADVVSMTGTNFSSWWQATTGSMLVRARQSIITGVRSLVYINDGTTDNIISLRGNAANPELYIKATADQVQIDAGTLAANTSYGMAGAWNANDCAAAFNGGAAVTDTSATIPIVDRMLIGSDGTNYLNGWIEKIDFWPQRIINAEVQAFSK